MAEHALDDLQRLALLDQLGSAGVAQLMQRVAQRVVFQERKEWGDDTASST